ncbi:MAG: elongation factor P, partial [Chloroflexi bacterium]|nr:elongation factor P [Chloroflexota bacterium]
FEQIPLSAGQMGDVPKYLKEGLVVQIFTHEGNALSVELPLNVDLKIVETGPSYKGDTASGGNKPAVMETGITVQVPLYLAAGDTIKVDTRTGTFVERA